MNEEFNQKSLDSYVNAMDESVQAYVERLIQLGANTAAPDIADLNNQLTLEVMLKTVFGDGSIILLGSNEETEIATAFRHICMYFN